VTVQQDPRVKLLLTIQEEEIPEESAAIRLLEKVKIPERPKAPEVAVAVTNGTTNGSTAGVRRKRTHSEAAGDEPPISKRKIAPEVIEIDDNAPISIDSDED
jgi:hypothetical protein